MTRRLTEDQKTKLLLLNMSVAVMQDYDFFCVGEDGVLRKWHPPRPVDLSEKDG
tara:strand:+ start:1130 stop:1291 length:162 start_codon:yes stop_codon:yes gene_type:complete